MSDIGTSLVRTAVPLIVGASVAFLAARGIDSGPYQDFMAQTVGAAVAGAYYTIVRVLETQVRPRFGWLLGSATAPAYDPPAS